MLRLGLTEKGVTEILGIAEHIASVSAVAEGLRLRPDVPTAPSGTGGELIDLASAVPEEAEPTLMAVREWSRSALGLERVPAFWAVFARKPRLLRAAWAKHRLVLGAGELDRAAKLSVALAVAMNKQSAYWTGYLAHEGRVAGVFDDEVIVEIAGAVMHYVAFNTISHGMMLEAPFTDLVAGSAPADPPPPSE